MIHGEYTTDDPHERCLEEDVHADTREAREQCDQEQAEHAAERLIERREW